MSQPTVRGHSESKEFLPVDFVGEWYVPSCAARSNPEVSSLFSGSPADVVTCVHGTKLTCMDIDAGNAPQA